MSFPTTSSQRPQTTTTTIILALGAWHHTFHSSPLLPYLPEKYGYKLIPVTLKTSVKSDPPPTIYDNIEQIAGVIEDEIVETGNRIVVVGHSVSGQSCVAALSRVWEKHGEEVARKRIVHLFFTACFLDPERTLKGSDLYSIDFSTMWCSVTPKKAYEVFYNGMERKEDARPFVEALGHNMAQMPPKEGYGEGWRNVPGTYFVCTEDKAIRPEMQRLEAKECGMNIVELEMDHCPFVSEPERFAEALHAVLKEC